MRPLLVTLGVLLALPAWSAPRESRRAVSANGVWRFQLFEEAPGKCRVEVVTDSGPAWSLPTCVGEVSDAFFISQDGQRFWVVKTLPNQASAGSARSGQGRAVPGWARTWVAEKYDREGRVLERRRLSQFLSPAGYRKVRRLAQRFTWLEGVNGVPGKGPRLDAEGRVALETVEGRTFELSLDPAPVKSP